MQKIGLFAIIFVLLPVAVAAQTFSLPQLPPGIPYYPAIRPLANPPNTGPRIMLNIQPTWARYRASFHEDQWEPGIQKFVVQMAAQVVFPRVGLLKFSFTPGFRTEETLTPSKYLNVGGTEWKTNKDSTSKPVTLGLDIGSTSRITADFFTRYPIRLTGAIEQANFTVSAKGEIDGKQVDVSEACNQVYYGGGVVWDMKPTLIRLTAGPGWRMVEAGIFYPVSSWAQIGAKYQFGQYTTTGFKARRDAVGIWGEVLF